MAGKAVDAGAQKRAFSRLSQVPDIKKRALYLGMAAAESDKDSGFSDGASDCQSSMEQADSDDVMSVLCRSAEDGAQQNTASKTGPFTALSPVLMMKNVLFRQATASVPQSWAVHPSFDMMSQAQPQFLFLQSSAPPVLGPPASSERRGYLPILNSYAKIAPHPVKEVEASHGGESDETNGPTKLKRLCVEKNTTNMPETQPSKSEIIPSKSDCLPSKSDDLPSKSDDLPIKSDSLSSKSDSLLNTSDCLSSKSHGLPSKSDALPSKIHLLLKKSNTLFPNTFDADLKSVHSPESPSSLGPVANSLSLKNNAKYDVNMAADTKEPYQTLSLSDKTEPSLENAPMNSSPSSLEGCDTSQPFAHEQQSKSKRFQNTLDVLHRSGLLEITMKTKELARQNRATQAELEHLKQQMQLFMEAMQSSMPQAWAKLQESLSADVPKAENGFSDTGILQVSLESFGM